MRKLTSGGGDNLIGDGSGTYEYDFTGTNNENANDDGVVAAADNGDDDGDDEDDDEDNDEDDNLRYNEMDAAEEENDTTAAVSKKNLYTIKDIDYVVRFPVHQNPYKAFSLLYNLLEGVQIYLNMSELNDIGR